MAAERKKRNRNRQSPNSNPKRRRVNPNRSGDRLAQTTAASAYNSWGRIVPNIDVRDENTAGDGCDGGGTEAGSGGPEGDSIGVLLNAAAHVAIGQSVLLEPIPSMTSSSIVHQINPEPLGPEGIYCQPELYGRGFDPMISGQPELYGGGWDAINGVNGEFVMFSPPTHNQGPIA